MERQMMIDDSSPKLSSLPEELGEQRQNEETISPSVVSSIPHRPATRSSLEKYSPVDWKKYFDEEADVCIPGSNDIFHIYKAGKEGPVVFCLHGGGYSGLSFPLAANIMKEKVRLVAMDLRGHGKSSSNNNLDLSIETLSNDVLAVLETMYGDSSPAIVLVGHSMGGSVAVHVAAKKALPKLSGLVVLDVVEGTAMASLPHMQTVLSSRPQYFATIEKAAVDISYAILFGTHTRNLIKKPLFLDYDITLSTHIELSVREGFLRSIDSARVSIPATLAYDELKKCYIHRARLEETAQYWRAWYEGLSEKFLSCPVAKLLLLAGTDRLDRTLTIGQMQGKFQMVVVKNTGHAIQEDAHEEFSNLVLNFITHNYIGPDDT